MMGTSLASSISANQSLYLNSWHFFLLGLVAVCLVRLLSAGAARTAIIAVLNVYFLSYFLPDSKAALVLAAFLITTWVIGEARRRWAWLSPASITLTVVVLFWVFLFFIKDPSLFKSINPFSASPVNVIGISYLVFRAISYISDVEILERHSFVAFVNYMIFFPTLLAGPIDRFDRFQEATNSPVPLTRDDALSALHRIANGLLKKFVLADNLFVFGIFALDGEVRDASLPLLWLGVLSQLLLFYLDFSGYCDVVIGLARLMGIALPENFNHPFRARNVQEFWMRWHMSLTGFIRDYVFSPLAFFTYRSLGQERPRLIAVTLIYVFCLLLIALWHATTEGFLVFGLMHGFALVVLQMKRQLTGGSAVTSMGSSSEERRSGLDWVARSFSYVFLSVSIVFWYFPVAHSIAILKTLVGAG
jgi:alginate O-acetyltransferase complex protein AlgI